MYTDVPLWGLSQSQTGAPFFCSLSGSSFPSVIHSSSVLFSSPSLASLFLTWSQSLGLEGEGVSFFRSFFPFHLVSYLLHLSWNSLVYSHKSFVFFGRVSDTLVCLGNRLEGPSRTAAREIRIKGEAVRNADEGKEVVKWGMLNGWDKTPWNN